MLKTCDISCYELASHFLADEPAAPAFATLQRGRLQSDDARQHLALHIQQCIEDEIELMRSEFPEENSG